MSRADAREREVAEHGGGRSCGACSVCCTVLRVDALRKLGGSDCVHQRRGAAQGACAIHPRRPRICRAYRCLWLQGGLEEADRPDRLGALVDRVAPDGMPRLHVREARPGAFDASPRLRAIAEAHRRSMPVHVHPPVVADDPDAPYRVLLAGGEEQRVRGEQVTVLRDGVPVATRRLPWLERGVRRLVLRLRALRVRGYRRAPAAPHAAAGPEA